MVTALERFIARRGIPSQIVTDNATNCVGAIRDLIELERVVQTGAAALNGHLFLLTHPTSADYGKQR